MNESASLPGCRPDPANKAELLACIRASWKILSQALAGRSLMQSGPGSWALKDHLAHITEWERFVLRSQFQGLSLADALQMNLAALTPFDVDRVNALLFERNCQRPPADVLADFHAVHAQLLAAIEAAGEDDLARRTQMFDMEINPVLVWVLYNTRDHYDEHLQNILDTAE